MGFNYWLLSLLFSLFDMHFIGFWHCSFSTFYTCLALDVDVCFASFCFSLISALFGSLGFCLRIFVKVIIKWMEIYFPFLFSSYAALFLSRDSGCKNTLIWVVVLFFAHKHPVIVLRVAVGHSDGMREGGHQIGPPSCKDMFKIASFYTWKGFPELWPGSEPGTE